MTGYVGGYQGGYGSVADLSVAIIRKRVVWVGCDLATGKIIAELPDLTGTVSRALGAYTSTSTSTPIPLSGPGAIGPAALQATKPGWTMVAAIVNDVPAWAGLVVKREGGTAADLKLSCVSPEGYLDRRFVRDHDFVQVDQCHIMAQVAGDAEDIDGIGQGLGLVHAITDSGVLRDQPYRFTDRATVYDRLQEMSRRQDGPEWTIDPEWADTDRTIIRLVLRIAPRIGTGSDDPHAVWDSRGAARASYRFDEDYSDGKGANWVQAYSSGEGDDKPTSAPAIDMAALQAGMPIFERHWQPSSSIRSQSILDDHAGAELIRLRDGQEALQLTARWDAFPRYGVDWRLGDDVGWELVGHRHPNGIVGEGRVIGWELNLQAGTLKPTLVEV